MLHFNLYNPNHSDEVQSLVKINPLAVSDCIINGFSIEFKETYTKKSWFNKGRQYFKYSYTFSRKDLDSHDYIIFHNCVTNIYYICMGSILMNYNCKDYSSITEKQVEKNCIMKTNFGGIKQWLNNLLNKL